MLKWFSTKDLILIALTGALVFIIASSVSIGINAATGSPLIGGMVVNLFVAYILVLALLILKKWGTATLILLIHTLLSVPTNNFGPPGIYKPLMGLFIGLIADTILYAGRYKKIVYYVAAALGFALAVPVLLFFLVILGLPGADKVMSLIWIIIAVYVIEALLGTWLAIITYNKKLKNKRFVRVFQS